MQLVLDIILNLVIMLSGFLVLGKIYDKQEEVLRFKIIAILLLTIGQAFVNYFENPYLNCITMLIVLMMMTILIFCCKGMGFVVYDIFIFFGYFIADFISNVIISLATKNNVFDVIHRSDLLLSRYLLDMILIFMLCNSVSIFLKKNKNDIIYWYEVTFYILLTLFESSSAAYIAYHIQQFSSGIFLIYFLIACFILDIYIVFVFHRLAESRQIEKEYLLIQQQSSIQLEVYQELSKKYENSVRIAHDAKKHVKSLEDLIKSEIASDYRDSLFQDLNKLYPDFQHSNKMLMVIINHELFKAEQSKIRLELHIEEVSLQFISDMDLTTIFVNILDNAVDACRTLNECRRIIQLYVEQRIGFIIIHISNPYETLNLTSDKKFKSTKYGHAGIGLSNVKQTVEKYNGVFSIETDVACHAKYKKVTSKIQKNLL